MENNILLGERYDIIIKKGTTFELSLYLSNDGNIKDIQGYDSHMQIREGHTKGNLLLDLTIDNGGIVIGEDNIIDIKITPIQTNGLKECEGNYDILLIDSVGDIECLLAGIVKIKSGVTQHEL